MPPTRYGGCCAGGPDVFPRQTRPSSSACSEKRRGGAATRGVGPRVAPMFFRDRRGHLLPPVRKNVGVAQPQEASASAGTPLVTRHRPSCTPVIPRLARAETSFARRTILPTWDDGPDPRVAAPPRRFSESVCSNGKAHAGKSSGLPADKHEIMVTVRRGAFLTRRLSWGYLRFNPGRSSDVEGEERGAGRGQARWG